ncbi:hypothetical protein G7Z17_g10776 [Cylindrodendrum hubeiense]|uniref:Clr5 domain-containing protein n=1 Tax=Cylindrodendrum hubeiense TaxID=595255 RepID=A0A9P5LC05_9HYPO|nr:hypothetical protein G7Z17_g10776 [Cylindrodendrum hubeiense]
MGDTAAPLVRGSGPKERHRRSSRITDATWDFYRPLLCKLYKSYTLVVVMAFMKERFGFAPSKRQYGYRFEKWGIRKYHSTDKQGPTRNLANADDLPNEQIVSEFFDAMSPDLNSPGYAAGLYLDVPGNGAAQHAPSNASATSATSDAGASFVDEDTDFEDGLSSPGNPIVPISYPWGADDEAKKLVADFCSAMSDDENAFGLYLDLYDLLSNSPASSATAKSLLVTSLARVAQQPHNANRGRALLSCYRDYVRTRGSDRPFLFSMLDANMEELAETSEKSSIHNKICDTVRTVLDDDTMLGDIPHIYSVIDLVAYHCLASGLEVYEKTTTTADGQLPTLSAEDLLYQYVYKQPLAEAIRQGDDSPLRGCITWCVRQLKLTHKVPEKIASIPCDDSQRRWCDNVGLFCTLWHTMLLLVQNGTPPPWYGPCESALGISPSELLVSVCWMVGAEVSSPDSVDDIFKRANTVAETINSLPEAKLWIKFLRTFTWMNKLVDPGDDDKTFEATLLQHSRRYISATLNVQLPFPAEPVVDIPESDFHFLHGLEPFATDDSNNHMLNIFLP